MLLTVALFSLSQAAMAADGPEQRFAATLGYSAHQLGGDNPVPVQLGNAYPPGTDVETSDDGSSASLGLTWYLTRNVALELWGASGADGDVEIDVENGPDIGVASYKTRPIALSAQYHFVDAAQIVGARITPFVGLGYHHTEISDVRSNAALPSYAGLTIESGNGLAASAGVDVALGQRWFVRGDVRYLRWSSESKVGGQPLADSDMDAVIYGASVGMRF
ncbi:hypothetical protein CSC62_08555 [Pseudoxanthomonas jiangsuensis]|nr:hypothetical protein CSC62_08555 [Pseudoxanthomonas jiangsuensis]